MTLNGLLPCPFCGGKAERVLCQDRDEYGSLIGFPFWAVKCKSCAAEIWNPEEQDGLEPDEMIEVAVKAWNTRAPGWIPCSERMPEDDVKVLGNITITVNTNIAKPKQRTIFAKHDRVLGWTTANGYPIVGKITHWMPTPDPPRENNHGI